MTHNPWGSAPDRWSRTPAPRVAPRAASWPAAGGWQPGGYSPPPPRRRRSFFGTLVRLAFVVVVAMFAFAVVRDALTGYSTGGASAGSTAQPGTTTAGSSSGGGGTSAGGTGGTQYQNEGYQAPPADYDPSELPSPTSYAQAEKWLTDNAVYAQNVPSPTDCTMEPIAAGASKAKLENDLNAMMACLMQVWEPAVVAAGFEMPRPPVTVYSSQVTTACGVMKEVNAAYCAGDQHVYYASSLLQALPSQIGSTKYAAEDVIAHEFGHAVQARTGILISDAALESRATKSDATVLARRLEQQADCFAGLYVESVAQSQGLRQSDLQNLVDMTYYLGDDVLSGNPTIQGDHGQGKSRQAWFAKGLSTNRVGVCNTWIVPAAQVR